MDLLWARTAFACWNARTEWPALGAAVSIGWIFFGLALLLRVGTRAQSGRRWAPPYQLDGSSLGSHCFCVLERAHRVAGAGRRRINWMDLLWARTAFACWNARTEWPALGAAVSIGWIFFGLALLLRVGTRAQSGR